MVFLKRYFGIFVVLLLSFWAIKPLFAPGFFPMHDDEQIGRLFELDQVIRAGHVPPRIVPNLGFGYGYPFFNFYPPFAYYIAEIFKTMGFSYIVSIKIMIALGFISASFFMYFFSKEFFGKIGGIVSAVLYTYAPYHAVDAYVRGALAELWSFVFLPAIFWSYYKLAKNSNLKFVIFAGFFGACFILSHNLVAVMSIPFIFVWFIFLLLANKNKSKFTFNSVLSIFLALGLSAYFWLPSYFEKQYTMISLLITELANYGQHFVYIRQFWDSPWGYGGSLYGLYDGLSFQAGKVHIILTFLLGPFMIFLFKKKNKNALIVLIFLGLFLLSLFMQTFYSKIIWDTILPLWYIQFPWRYLVFTAFASSFMIGAFFAINFFNRLKIVIGVFIVFIVIFINMNYFKPSKHLVNVIDKDYTSQEILRWKTSKMAAEYVPKGIATRKTDIGTTVVDINKNEIAKKSYNVINGSIKVQLVEDKPNMKLFNVFTNTGGMFRINTFSFPGWKVYLNNKEVAQDDNNKLKLITVYIPKGTFQVKAVFGDTLIRIIGNGLSFISLILIITYSLVRKDKNFL